MLVSTNTTQKRQDIVKQAYDVFYRHGFHATAVDKILSESGISKRTVYKYFRSKEELIAASIAYYQGRMIENLRQEVERRGTTPAEKILVIFDIKREAFEKGDGTGCFALNAKMEYDGKNEDIENACASFVKGLEKLVYKLCAEIDPKTALEKTTQILLLLHGAIVYSQARQTPQIITTAKETVRQLILKD